jgi:ribonuclease-3
MFDFNFKNNELLKQALLHRSYLNEHPEIKLDHNERLEFLGDAVLELVVTDYLYHKYPNRDEGELTAYRAALVNAETLGTVAAELGVNDHLLLSRGEAKDNGRARQVILANTFEAIVGAMYLDQGYAAAQIFIGKYLLPLTDEIVAKKLWVDAKSYFQEQAQELRDITPTYKVLSELGPDHDKVFTVGLYLGSELVAKGQGPSKQRAEQEAARAGLAANGWDLQNERHT